DLERWSTSFDVAAAMTDANPAVGVGDNAREMRVGAVSASYWSLFDMRPVIGRFFTAAEDTTPVGAPVTVLSYAFWQSRYGGRSDALGQRVKIAKVDYTIIGGAPANLTGNSEERVPVAWIPITAYAGTEFTWNPKDLHNWYEKYNISWMQMVVRRKPGVSLDVATADLTNAYKRSYQKQRDMSPQTTLAEIARPRAVAASILAARGPNPSEVSKVARWVSGVAMIVMLIAAANVANLLLARALRRRREVAVRLALGVSRARLLSQLLTESLILAVIGGTVGLVVAQWGGAALRAAFFTKAEPVVYYRDPRTVLFAGGAAVIVGILAGLAPIFQTSSASRSLVDDLKAGAREGMHGRSRVRVALLVVQGALSVVLLVGAGLFVRSVSNVRSARLGYDVDPVMLVDLNMRGVKLDSVHTKEL